MQPCTGLFCTPEAIAGAIVLGIITLSLTWLFARAVLIKITRRRRGLEPMRLREMLGASMSGRVMRRATSSQLSDERQLRRQMDWEKEQVTQEMMRTGQPVQRQFCKTHQRWCYHAWEEGHPPGGTGNPTVPDDWPPDLSKRKRPKS